MPNETTPNELGDVAVGSVDNPYPDRIEDPEKARAMAEAGNSDRSFAAYNRPRAEELIEKGFEETRDNVQQSKRFAAEADEKADEKESQAEQLYDAKQSIDHKLKPLTDAQEKEAMTYKREYEHRSNELESDRADYEAGRAIEDTLNSAYDAVMAVDKSLEELDGEALRSAAVAYLKEITQAKTEIGEKIKTAADSILRTEEKVDQSNESVAQHVEKHKAAYYDSALQEMTDKGIPFESNNPDLNHMEQAA